MRDWITASETALAMSWIMVALWVTTDTDVIVSVGVGHVAGAADATGAVRPRRTLLEQVDLSYVQPFWTEMDEASF